MVMKADIVLPKHLEKIPSWTSELPEKKYSWFTNEEIASILLSFNKHDKWMTDTRICRPENGQVIMVNRKKVKYRQDLYIWKRRKNRKWAREDHVKLKVNGHPFITALYVHSDILPTFHRRCYWIIQNPDVRIVHYLNYPYVETSTNLSKDICLNRKNQEWQHLNREEILQQIKPMFANMPWPKLDDLPMAPEMVDFVANRLVSKHFDFVNERCNNLQPKCVSHKVTFFDDGFQESALKSLNSNCSDMMVSCDRGCIIGNEDTVFIVNNAGSMSNCVATHPSVLNSESMIFPKLSNYSNSASAVACDTNSLIQQTAPIRHMPIVHSNVTILKSLPNDDEKSEKRDTGLSTQMQCNMKQIFADVSKNVKSLISEEKHAVVSDSQAYGKASHSINAISSQDCSLPDCASSKKQIQPLSSCSIISDSTTTVDKKKIGAKKVMVPLCKDVVMSPFSNKFSDGDDLGSDMFDINGLFANTIDTASLRVSPSNESCDLFSQQFWNPDLQDCDTSASSVGICSLPDNFHLTTSDGSNEEQLLPKPTTNLASILDYSPDWSYTEGGAKILITGTWSHDGNYMCLFSDIPMPASVVQPGVLRCYCPAHEAGQVDLVVWRNGKAVSQSVKFEYKVVSGFQSDAKTQWLQINNNNFVSSILERLEQMEKKISSLASNGHFQQTTANTNGSGLHYRIQILHLDTSSNTFSGFDLEQRLISLCLKISHIFDEQQLPLNLKDETSFNGMTLLHYASALGFSRLLKCLQSLSRCNTNNSFLSHECSPSNVDVMNCTPLMWAAALNQLSSLDILCQWSSAEMLVVDVWGRSPAMVAFQRGHVEVFERLEQLLDENLKNQCILGDDSSKTSSLVDVTACNITESSDSGEDSMETDDNFSLVENDAADITSLYSSSNIRTFNNCTSQNNIEIEEEGNKRITERKLSSLKLQASDTVPTVNNDSVTSLAEQILEATPGHFNMAFEGALELSCSRDLHEEDLTLKSFPFYVNSRCTDIFYQRFATTQDLPLICPLKWCEFLQLPPKSSNSNQYHHEDIDLAAVCLTDRERRQLHYAARLVVNACIHKIPVDTHVLRASILIQRCYNKYKRFAINKKMNEAAVLIQSKFRSYQEQKKFQKSRHAAILIQSFYRSYKYTRTRGRATKQTVRMIEDALRGHVTKKKQHQAARKIQRFLRRCHFRLHRRELNLDSSSISSCMSGFYAC